MDGGEVHVETVDEAQAALSRLLSVTGASYEERSHLERALSSRIRIEQAKGVLAERFGVGIDDAFELLRGAARGSRLNLHALAEAVVASRETPRAIEKFLNRARRENDD